MPATEIKKPKLLLHICCAGCGVFISQLLRADFTVVLYYYNPNIFPAAEYEARLKEVENIVAKYDLNLIIGKYDHDQWLKKIAGHANDKEKGERCLICYRDRLESTAQFAREKKFDYFTTTLTVSPHKVAKAIIDIGNDLARQYQVFFLGRDFKKQDGFKKSMELAKQLNLYKQNYCGCEFSKQNK